jgi:hypothetical protein
VIRRELQQSLFLVCTTYISRKSQRAAIRGSPEDFKNPPYQGLLACADSGIPEKEKLVLASILDLCENATEEELEDPSMRLQNALRLLCTTAKGTQESES